MRLDFKHFQHYATFSTEEPEGWRGEIREGEVVRSHEDASPTRRTRTKNRRRTFTGHRGAFGRALIE